MKRLVSVLGKAVAAGALVSGFATVVSQGVASASTPTTYYATPGGPSLAVNTPCTNPANPCDLTTALSSEASNSGGAPGSVIKLAGGSAKTPAIYTEALTLTSGNNNVTIVGKSSKTTVLGANGAHTIDFSGTTGVTVEKVTVVGTGPTTTSTVFDGGGGSGTLATSRIVGATTAPTFAVRTLGGNTTLSNDTIQAGTPTKACQATVKAASSASAPSFLTVKFPKCYNNQSPVTISNPTLNTSGSYAAVRTGAKTLNVTSGSGTTLATGDIVTFTAAMTSAAAYGTSGIEADAGTVTVSGGSVSGPSEAGSGPVGILVATATATVQGVHVSGNSNTTPGLNQAHGVGIEVAPSTNTVTIGGQGNSVTGNDVGIVVSGANSPAGAVVNVKDNTVSGNSSAGVVLAATVAPALTVNLTGNTISGQLTGAGLELQGSINQTLGDSLAGDTNTISGNGVGVAIAALGAGTQTLADPLGFNTGGPGNSEVDSLGNTVQYASITGNLAIGAEVTGKYTPLEFAGGEDPNNNQDFGGLAPNTFTHDAFSGNASAASGANVADFDAFTHTQGCSSLTYTASVLKGSAISTTLPVSGSCSVSGGDAFRLADGGGGFVPGTLYINTSPFSSVGVSGAASLSSSVISSTFLTVGNSVGSTGILNGDTMTGLANAASSSATVMGASNTPAACAATLTVNASGVPLTTATNKAGYYAC